jgi:hypothetical protein
MSVWPPARMQQHGSHRTDFREILYLRIFLKSALEGKVSSNPGKNKEYIQ